MSHVGRKTEAVLEKGKQARETWSPRLGSTPLRHYLWWRQQTGKVRPQENFCHFWRVVLIWAPLLRLRKMTLDRNAVVWMRRNVGGGGLVIAACVLYLTALFAYSSVAIARELWGAVGAWAILLGPLSVVACFAALIGCIVAFSYGCKGTAWLYRKFMSSGEWTNEPVKPIISRRVRQSPLVRRQLPQRARVASGKLKRSCRSVGEYIVLMAQVVRVKKWKICPLVEIPELVSLDK